MKNKILLLGVLTTAIIVLSGCNATPTDNPQTTGKSTLNIQQRVVHNYTPEEKAKVLDEFNAAAKKEDYQKFADLLAEIYQRGLQGDHDFVKVESALYVKGTQYFDEGLTDQAYRMADTIFAKVFESWRFKYLKVRCLERYGLQAFAKKDYAKAKDYANKILAIEYRPEGANLIAKIAIQEAQDALQKNDKAGAKAALMQTSDMQLDPALQQQIEAMLKKLQ